MRKLFAVLLVGVMLLAPATSFAADVLVQKIEGYLSDTYEKDAFTVYCESDNQVFVFDWNNDADVWVKVFGETGKLLGDFQLSEGEEIILKGGGKFKLQVYSESGAGFWSAVPKADTSTDTSTK
jgi:hypothetical protein